MPEKFKLTLADASRSGGRDPGDDDAYKFEVRGLPADQAADIALHDYRWRVLRIRAGHFEGWTGDYATAGEALAALQIAIDREHGA